MIVADVRCGRDAHGIETGSCVNDAGVVRAEPVAAVAVTEFVRRLPQIGLGADGAVALAGDVAAAVMADLHDVGGQVGATAVEQIVIADELGVG